MRLPLPLTSESSPNASGPAAGLKETLVEVIDLQERADARVEKWLDKTVNILKQLGESGA